MNANRIDTVIDAESFKESNRESRKNEIHRKISRIASLIFQKQTRNRPELEISVLHLLDFRCKYFILTVNAVIVCNNRLFSTLIHQKFGRKYVHGAIPSENTKIRNFQKNAKILSNARF